MGETFARLLKPYNRAHLARVLGTTRGRVNRWAHGIGAPGVFELPKLAHVLRIDVATLLVIIVADTDSPPNFSIAMCAPDGGVPTPGIAIGTPAGGVMPAPRT